MLQTVKRYIEKNNLLNPGDKMVVGLSGGGDSVVLLSILHSLGYKCLAAHCNFHLRAEESGRDEKFAADFAASLPVPFFKQDFDTRAAAKAGGISIEMAARDLRYEWFEELRKNGNATAIAVAHHQDDSIETLLLNLIRGTGIKGLTGIKPRSGLVVRPLLCVSKVEILQYAQTENLPFVTDSSNNLPEFTRNKIRLQVIPLLKTLNPSINEALSQTMHNLNEAAKIYDAEIEKVGKTIFDEKTGQINIPLLKTFPSPETLLFELLKDFGFRKEVVFEIYKAIDGQPGKVFYSQTHRLVKDREAFLLLPVEDEKAEKKTYWIQPDETGIIEFPFRMEIQVQERPLIQPHKHIAYLDRDKLHFPLLLRKWQAGDKFIPFGMKGFQKLSNFFNNNKISKPEKEKIWLLLSGEDIVWVVNHRIDDRFRIDEDTKNAYIIRIL
ncbi:tRNA(Ile)-lysidine synthase [Bacteroidia bacterium]|nr:tRNA(Ile)-lysidine synthase [Bacteroidia bacterium]